jgi:hypothetical protein
VAQFRQPDFSKGDPNTLGGYVAVHDRPAAFEGSDGFSYSVEILTDQSDARPPWGAYLFFVKWARIGASSPEGHLESEIIVRAASEDEARERAGALSLSDVKRLLDSLIQRAPTGAPRRKWWDAMAAEHGESDDNGKDGGTSG